MVTSTRRWLICRSGPESHCGGDRSSLATLEMGTLCEAAKCVHFLLVILSYRVIEALMLSIWGAQKRFPHSYALVH